MPRNTWPMIKNTEETEGGDKETSRRVRTEWANKLDDDDSDDDDSDDESLELQVIGFQWARKVILGQVRYGYEKFGQVRNFIYLFRCL